MRAEQAHTYQWLLLLLGLVSQALITVVGVCIHGQLLSIVGVHVRGQLVAIVGSHHVCGHLLPFIFMGSCWSLLKVVIVGGHCYLLLLCIGGGWGWWLLLVVCVDGGGKEKGSHIKHHHIGITFELSHEITCK